MNNFELRPEDYVEPRCLLCENPYGVTEPVKSVPQARIIQRLNEFMADRDYNGAERHLLYWLEEAKLGHDLRGQLLIRNELIGHYRKTGDKDKSLANAAAALALLDTLNLDGSVSAGTTYVNAATAYNAFGDQEKSLNLFEKARKVYESDGLTDKSLLGGLYNNMGLNLFALGRYDEALELYDRALLTMEEVDNGRLEQAITYLNMADVYAQLLEPDEGEARVYKCLDSAYELLTSGEISDMGYYAFVCEKCAPSFEYYGYFLAAQDLNDRANAAYQRKP